ncbi:MAG: fur [Verrucomicrobiales bacterium]|nr:fur [Verrucomicrobiales bacterium]
MVWALEVCERSRMRPTPIRQKILEFLADRRVPTSLEVVMREGVQGKCSETTAYRTLMLLKELQIIRQVSFPKKTSYFVLNIPGESSHFLVCQSCREVTELPVSESARDLDREISASRGYSQIYHDLEFFGICPACQKQPARARCPNAPLSNPLVSKTQTVTNGVKY